MATKNDLKSLEKIIGTYKFQELTEDSKMSNKENKVKVSAIVKNVTKGDGLASFTGTTRGGKSIIVEKIPGDVDKLIDRISFLSDDEKNLVVKTLFEKETFKDFEEELNADRNNLGFTWNKPNKGLAGVGLQGKVAESREKLENLREKFLTVKQEEENKLSKKQTAASNEKKLNEIEIDKLTKKWNIYNDKMNGFMNAIDSPNADTPNDPLYDIIKKVAEKEAKEEKDKAIEQSEKIVDADEIKEQPKEIKEEGNDMKTYSDVSEVKKEINVLTESMYEQIGKFFTGAEVIYKTEQNGLVKYKGTGAREFVKKQFTEAFAKISKEIVYGDYRERFTKSISTVLENIKSVSVKGETSEQDAKIVESKNKEAKEALKFAISDYFESNSMGNYGPGRTEEVNMTEAMHKTIADFNKVITEVEKTYNNQPNNDKAGEGESFHAIKMPRTSQVDDEEAEKHFEEVQSKIGEFGFISGANGQSGTPTQPEAETEDVADETPAAATAEQTATNPSGVPADDTNAVNTAGEGENSANDQEDVNDDSNSYTDGELPDYESEKPVNIAGSNGGNNIVGGSNPRPTPIYTTDENGNQIPYEEETNADNENGVKPRGFFSKIGRWARRHPFIAAITATAAVTVGGALLGAIPVFAGIANGISSLVIGGAAASVAMFAGGLVARGVSDNYKSFIAKYDIEKHQKKIRKGQYQAQRLMDRAAAAIGTNRTSVAAQAANIKTQSVANQALAKNYNAIMDGGRNSKQRAIEAYFEKKNVKAFDKKVKKDTTEFEKIEKKINKLYDLGDIKEAERLEAYLDEEMSKQDQRVAFNDVVSNLRNARSKNRNARTDARNLQDKPYYNGTYNNGNAGAQTQSSTYTPGNIYEQRRNNVQQTGAYTQQPVNRVNGANVGETTVKFRASNPAVETTEAGYTATPSNTKPDVKPVSGNAGVGAGNGLVPGVTQVAGDQQTAKNYADKALTEYIAQEKEKQARLQADRKREQERADELRKENNLLRQVLSETTATSAKEREELTKKFQDSQKALNEANGNVSNLTKQLNIVDNKLKLTKQRLNSKTAEVKANAKAEVDKAKEERKLGIGVAKEQTAAKKHEDNVNKRDFKKLEAKKNAQIKAVKQETQKLNRENDQLKAQLSAVKKENDRLNKGIEANKAVIKASKPSLLARIAGFAKDVFAKHSEEKTARVIAKETGKARINEFETKISGLQKEAGVAEQLLNESATQTKEFLEQNATKDAKIATQEKEIADLNGLIGYADELLAAGKITEEAYEQLLDEACQKYPEAAKAQEKQEWKREQGAFGPLKRIKGFRSGSRKFKSNDDTKFIPADAKNTETAENKPNTPSNNPNSGKGGEERTK